MPNQRAGAFSLMIQQGGQSNHQCYVTGFVPLQSIFPRNTINYSNGVVSVYLFVATKKCWIWSCCFFSQESATFRIFECFFGLTDFFFSIFKVNFLKLKVPNKKYWTGSLPEMRLLLCPAKRRVVVTLGRLGSLLSIHSPLRVLAAQRASLRTGVSRGQKGGTALTNHLKSHSNETRKLSCL